MEEKKNSNLVEKRSSKDILAQAKKRRDELKKLNDGKKPSIDDGRRKACEFGDGASDHLVPLKALDLKACNSVSELVNAMKYCSFGARSMGEAADVLYEMTVDPKLKVVGTFSGAMTIAKMGLVICDMIEDGMIDAMVTTGALMAHGFVEAAGMKHFKYNWDMGDKVLYQKGYDRVYDTLELERNLDDAEEIFAEVVHSFEDKQNLCSYKICRALGKYLHEHTTGRGILKSAYECKVPVYIPAFTDSELGLNFGVYRRRMKLEGAKPLVFNPFLDLEHYTNFALKAEEMGIFTIGGGVPRNWAQQVGPYLEIVDERVGTGGGFKRFKYAVRICPEPVHWGGLSGCTYSEGVSWGKFVPSSEGGKQVEVYSDATIAWPIIVKAVQERLNEKKQNPTEGK